MFDIFIPNVARKQEVRHNKVGAPHRRVRVSHEGSEGGDGEFPDTNRLKMLQK